MNGSALLSSMNSFSSGVDDSQLRDQSLLRKRKGYINLNIFTTDEGSRPSILPVMKAKPSMLKLKQRENNDLAN